MKGSFSGLVEALIEDDADLLVQDLLWKLCLGFLNLCIDVGDLMFPHLVVGHPAGGAVDFLQHLPAVDVDQVSTFQRYVPRGGEHQFLHTDWALRSPDVLQTFVFRDVGNAIPTFLTVSVFLHFAPSTHLALILHKK